MKKLIIALNFSLLFVSNVAAKEDSKDTFWVETLALECVLSQINAYLALEKDPIIVFLDLCPKIEPNIDDILVRARNSFPEIKESSDESRSISITRIMALSRKELVCLSQMFSEGSLSKPQHIKEIDITETKISLNNCESLR